MNTLKALKIFKSLYKLIQAYTPILATPYRLGMAKNYKNN